VRRKINESIRLKIRGKHRSTCQKYNDERGQLVVGGLKRAHMTRGENQTQRRGNEADLANPPYGGKRENATRKKTHCWFRVYAGPNTNGKSSQGVKPMRAFRGVQRDRSAGKKTDFLDAI